MSGKAREGPAQRTAPVGACVLTAGHAPWALGTQQGTAFAGCIWFRSVQLQVAKLAQDAYCAVKLHKDIRDIFLLKIGLVFKSSFRLRTS